MLLAARVPDAVQREANAEWVTQFA
jgi:hypothetical protein